MKKQDYEILYSRNANTWRVRLLIDGTLPLGRYLSFHPSKAAAIAWRNADMEAHS